MIESSGGAGASRPSCWWPTVRSRGSPAGTWSVRRVGTCRMVQVGFAGRPPTHVGGKALIDLAAQVGDAMRRVLRTERDRGYALGVVHPLRWAVSEQLVQQKFEPAVGLVAVNS